MPFGIGTEFDTQTSFAAIGTGACFATALWITIDAFLAASAASAASVAGGGTVIPALSAVDATPLIFAFVFILPLFMMNSNLIKKEESSFDFDNESSCRRKVFFSMLILQFFPFLGSIGLLFKPVKSDLTFEVQLVIGMFFTLLGALLLKIGTYKAKDEDNSF